MIAICEPNCKGLTHVPFNSALLASINLAFPHDDIIFLAENNHINCIKDHLNNHNIPIRATFQPVDISQHELLEHKSLYENALSYNPQRIFFSSVSILGLLSISLSDLRELDVRLVFHNALSKLDSTKPLIKYISKLIIDFGFRRKIRYIVLAEYIYHNVISKFPYLEKALCWIDHPYIFSKKKEKISKVKRNTYGFIGFGSYYKGFDIFLSIISNKKINANFLFAGHVSSEFIGLNSKRYGLKFETSPLQRDIYDSYIEQMDYILLPFRDSYYRYVMSGSFLDCLYYLKPCLTLKNSLTTGLFNRLGDIGYICNDYVDLNETIIHLSNSTENSYMNKIFNIEQAQAIFEPSSIARQINERLN